MRFDWLNARFIVCPLGCQLVECLGTLFAVVIAIAVVAPLANSQSNHNQRSAEVKKKKARKNADRQTSSKRRRNAGKQRKLKARTQKVAGKSGFGWFGW